MHRHLLSIIPAGMVVIIALSGAAGSAGAQEHVHPPEPSAAADVSAETGAQETAAHRMWMTVLPGGWHLMGMAQIYPSATAAAPFSSDSPLSRNQLAFPHAALMANFESPDGRWVLRLMPNFEALTLPDGEVAFGGWGEGYIDARHPHTFLHEAMLSFNWWNAPGAQLSLSAGRGFAPFGTGDPMYRPALKYPTNHHLSQILERWTANLSYVNDHGLGIELGLFDGNEPEDEWDFGNFRNFGNSWSGRLSYRIGERSGISAPWEISASYGRVREAHGADEELTVLYNAALRHDRGYDFGQLYGLLEASTSEPEEGDGYFSILAEVQAGLGADSRHRPYYRVEYATRPEFPREAAEGERFFRYDHDDHAAGATRWLINSAGYGYDLTSLPLSARPFIEMSHNRIRQERGPASVSPENLFGGNSFWSFSAGVRLFLGGGPMRMGSYGVLDDMTAAMRGSMEEAAMPEHGDPMDHDDHGKHDFHE